MQLSNQEDATDSFVLACRTRLQNILQRLEWSQEGVLKDFNTNSLAATPKEPKNPMQIAAAVDRDYPTSCPTNNCFVLATPELQNLLQDDKLEAPNNFCDLQANFSRQQKLQIYEHVIQNTRKLDNNSVDKVPDGEQSLAEIVASNKREAKRKKRKFRIAKPTRIEEVRALIDLQMQSLQQFIRNQKEVGRQKEYKKLEDYTHPTDSRTRFHQRDSSKSYSDRYKHIKEKCKSNRSSNEKFDRPSREYESSRNSTSRKTETFSNERNANALKYKERIRGKSPKSGNGSERKVVRVYEKHKRSRSRSPYRRKDQNDTRTYQKTKDAYNNHKRKRSKSVELDRFSLDKSSRSNKLDDKVNYDESFKDRDYERRGRSRGKSSELNKFTSDKSSRSKKLDYKLKNDESFKDENYERRGRSREKSLELDRFSSDKSSRSNNKLEYKVNNDKFSLDKSSRIKNLDYKVNNDESFKDRDYERRGRSREKSLELHRFSSDKSARSNNKLDYKVNNDEKHKTKDYERRGRSREKHRHHKKTHKKSRSRSESRRHHTKRDDIKDKVKRKHRR